MRSPADALKDPRPGDVFKLGSSTLTVTKANEDFRYNFHGWIVDAPEWWAGLAPKLEVTYVSND